MCQTVSTEFSNIENWLVMLLTTYKTSPSNALAKTISFYLNLLLHHDDINFCGDRRCEYIVMHRFWHWLAVKNGVKSA